LSAKVLDRQRLGKQRIETKQIVQTLLGESKGLGWANHPAVLMWKGHEYQLCIFGVWTCREWILRGYEDNQLTWFVSKSLELSWSGASELYPLWFGNERVHGSHKRKLIWKDPDWYLPRFPEYYGEKFDEEPAYFWPGLVR
jgi:hypothetical protein